jgi:hypothetical protein
LYSKTKNSIKKHELLEKVMSLSVLEYKSLIILSATLMSNGFSYNFFGWEKRKEIASKQLANAANHKLFRFAEIVSTTT